MIGTLLNGLTFGSLLFLISSGFTVMFGLMRVLNLAHGAFYLLGALVGVVTYEHFGSFPLAVVAGLLSVAALGFVTEVTLFRRVRNYPTREVLLTLGLGMLIVDLALAVFGGDPRRLALPDSLGGNVEILGVTFPKYRLILLGVAVVLFALMYVALERTKIGAIVRASVDDPEMLAAVGIDTQKVGTAVFVGSSAIVGATGVLGAGYLGVYPGVDSEILVYAVVVVIVGGLGSLQGAAIGSVIVGLLFSLGSVYAPSLLYFIMFAPVIVFLYFRPTGIRGIA